MKRAHRNSAAWIAIFAMALQALWPLIAQARPAMPGTLVHVCSVDGRAHFIELARDESPLEKRSAAQHQHCPLCVFDGDRVVVLPPPSIAALIVPVALMSVSEPRAVHPPVAQSYPPAQPRAPPVFS